MSDYTDAMLDGVFCQMCGEYIGDGCGFPRSCPTCALEESEDRHDYERRPVRTRTFKVQCPKCGKMVKRRGLKDHDRDVHGGDQDDVGDEM